jgi:hypothetical protein
MLKHLGKGKTIKRKIGNQPLKSKNLNAGDGRQAWQYQTLWPLELIKHNQSARGSSRGS